MNRILVLLFINLCIFQIKAQEQVKTKIFLKSGTILIADLIDYYPDSIIVFKIVDKEIILPMTSVKKLVMLYPNFQEKNNEYDFGKKWYNNSRMSNIGNSDSFGYSFTHSLLFQMKPKWLIGGGVGIENYFVSYKRNMIPIFAETKYYFIDQKATPFISLRLGYSFISDQEDSEFYNSKGGININPVVGYRLFGNKFFTEIFAGLKKQNMYFEEQYFGSIYKTRFNANRLEFGISLIY